MDAEYLEAKLKEARRQRKDGNRDEAFSIYRRLIKEIDSSEVLSSQFEYEAVTNEMAKQLFEESSFGSYLHAVLTTYWHVMVGLAAQGRFEGFTSPFDTFGPKAKINKALKQLGLLEQKQQLNAELFEFVRPFEAQLMQLSELARRTESSGLGGLNGLSIGERLTQVLRELPDYMNIYHVVRGPIMEQFYKKYIETRCST